MLALIIFHYDCAEHTVTADDGKKDAGFAGIRSGIYRGECISFRGRSKNNRLVRSGHPDKRAIRARRPGWHLRQSFTVFVNIQSVNEVGLFIIPVDLQIAGIQHLAQFIAHQIHDGLEVQLGRQALLDAVDDL